MFKKVVIADTCAIYVNDIFANYADYSGPTLMVGAVFFAFQIYGDFSGYSDIAIGTARLFGIRLMTNFRAPYFSRDIAEFWRRWHISLSTWFRDYVYIPLGGSRVGKWKAVRNTFVIFLVSGFWHGANWTFIVWGLIHALLFLPLLLRGSNRRNTGEIIGLPSFREVLSMAWTFAVVVIAWVFFRASDLNEASSYLYRFSVAPESWFESNSYFPPIMWRVDLIFLLVSILLLGIIESMQSKISHLYQSIRPFPLALFMVVWIYLILISPAIFADESFIYFQF